MLDSPQGARNQALAELELLPSCLPSLQHGRGSEVTASDSSLEADPGAFTEQSFYAQQTGSGARVNSRG